MATTPVDKRVFEFMTPYFLENYGNADSVDHDMGLRAKEAVKTAKKEISSLVNAFNSEIIFTSGATESINMALKGFVKRLLRIKPSAATEKIKIGVSPVEHKAVLNVLESLNEDNLIELHIFNCDDKGRLYLEEIESYCSKSPHLICVMAVNNETGNIYPVKEISEIAKKHNVKYFCDATQAAGKIPFEFSNWGIDAACISAHKMYGPKGSGALIFNKDFLIDPIIEGGAQQKGFRAGTLNIPGIVGLGKACFYSETEMAEDAKKMIELKTHLKKRLCENIGDIVFTGDDENQISSCLYFAVPGIINKAIIARVRNKLCISTGSACNSGLETPSHVLKAMNLPEEIIEGALRISFMKDTTIEDIDTSANIIAKAVHEMKRLV